MPESSEIAALNDRLSSATPKEIINAVLEVLPKSVLAFSGAEDVLLLHYASKLEIPPIASSLIPGDCIARPGLILSKFDGTSSCPFRSSNPIHNEWMNLLITKGCNSFYKDGHEECCNIRKVEPLRAHLQNYDAWITGQRQDQSPTRRQVPVIELDESFSSPQHQVLKINPLANVSSDEVWQQIRLLEIPYNPLHDRGFVSIGCEPCTKAIGPGQHEREGRWWWEESNDQGMWAAPGQSGARALV